MDLFDTHDRDCLPDLLGVRIMCVKRDPFSSFSYISCDVLKKIYDFFSLS